MRDKRSRVRGIVLLAAMTALAASSASAATGIVTITQTKAKNGGVTPGDTPGFPVTISKSGSYQLITNLTPPSAEGSRGIEITAENVVIDLNGFSVIGPRTCPDEDAFNNCTPAAEDPTYVLITGGRNVTIKNGTVRGSIGTGIGLNAHARIENVNVIWNSIFGVLAGKGSTLKDSLLAQNGQGVFFGTECLVAGNRFRVNPFISLQMTGSACSYYGNFFDDTPAASIDGGRNAGMNVCASAMCP
jgi:hypothetical protein